MKLCEVVYEVVHVIADYIKRLYCLCDGLIEFFMDCQYFSVVDVATLLVLTGFFCVLYLHLSLVGLD